MPPFHTAGSAASFMSQHMIEHNGPLFICWLRVGRRPASAGSPPPAYVLLDSHAGYYGLCRCWSKMRDGEDTTPLWSQRSRKVPEDKHVNAPVLDSDLLNVIISKKVFLLFKSQIILFLVTALHDASTPASRPKLEIDVSVCEYDLLKQLLFLVFTV